MESHLDQAGLEFLLPCVLNWDVVRLVPHERVQQRTGERAPVP